MGLGSQGKGNTRRKRHGRMHASDSFPSQNRRSLESGSATGGNLRSGLSPVSEPVTSDDQTNFIRKPMNAKYCRHVCRARDPFSPKENEQPGTQRLSVRTSPTLRVPLGFFIAAPFESMMGPMFVIRHQAAAVSGVYLCCCFGRLSKGPFSSDMSGRQSNKEHQ